MDFHEFEAMLTSVNNTGRSSHPNRVSAKLNSSRQQIKMTVELKISAVRLTNAEDLGEFSICWVRSSQKINTKFYKASEGRIKFGDKFMMTTNMEYDLETGKLFNKPVSTCIKLNENYLDNILIENGSKEPKHHCRSSL